MIYTCSKCNKTFSIKSNLVRHEKKHDTEIDFLCSQCDSHFANDSDLKRHLEIQKELLKCSDCGKTFKERKTFTRHKTTHQDEQHDQLSIPVETS